MMRTSQRDSTVMTSGGASRCLLMSLLVLNQEALPAMGERPMIRSQPQGKAVTLHQQAAIGVMAGGTPPLRYQWYKDNLPVPGATNDQVVFSHARFSDAARYSVVVSNEEGNVTSSAARLTVVAPGPGSLDASFTGGVSINESTSSYVHSMTVQDDGRALIGGFFRAVNGVPAPGIARLWGTADLQPRITSLQRDRSGTHLTWDALPGREYRVQFTRDLSAPDWADLPGETPGSVQGIGTMGDPVANDTSRRFYRVQLLR